MDGGLEIINNNLSSSLVMDRTHSREHFKASLKVIYSKKACNGRLSCFLTFRLHFKDSNGFKIPNRSYFEYLKLSYQLLKKAY